jgi:RNA polymerase sigma factor (sigma-70 family)
MSSESGAITALFKRIHEGSAEEKAKAKHEIIDLLYRDFKQRAYWGRRHERDKFTHDEFDKAANEYQLVRAFVRAVRQALIDHARAVPPGAGQGGELDDLVEDVRRRGQDEVLPQIEVLSLNEALKALAAEYPRVAEVLELRFFGSRQMAEIATPLGISPRTVERDVEFGLAWLRDFLSPENDS